MTLVWIARETVVLIHQAQLAEHGGLPGLRSATMLDSALDAPENLSHYGEPDAYDLAACYGWRLAANHPFLDGNKRTAWVCTRLFLRLNGLDINATDEEKIAVMLQVAAGATTEVEFAEWLCLHGRDSH